jgi:polyhydroxybutyrate depolymerase
VGNADDRGKRGTTADCCRVAAASFAETIDGALRRFVSGWQMQIGTLLMLGILALLGAAYRYYWYSASPPEPPLSASIRRKAVSVGDRERMFLIYAPARLPSGSPLVIVLHGSGMDGSRMRVCTGYRFDRLADQLGFVVLYPDGYRRNWNDCRKRATFPAKLQNIDDMSFIRALIARVLAEHSIDKRQVHAFGYSNGGHMAFRLATEAPDEIASIVTVAASLPTRDASSCPQEGRTSRVMLINGTADPINPYGGGNVTLFGLGSRGSVISSMASAQHFVTRNGVERQPISAVVPCGTTKQLPSVQTLTWKANGKPFCCLITVRGGGHVIPQSAYRFPRLLGPTTREMDAPAEAVRFFEIG